MLDKIWILECLIQGGLCKTRHLRPWNASHWLFPRPRTLCSSLVNVQKDYIKTSFASAHHFFLWMRQRGAFTSHKSLTRIIWAKETADGAVSFKFLANYSSSPHELPSGKPEMLGNLMEMPAFCVGNDVCQQ